MISIPLNPDQQRVVDELTRRGAARGPCSLCGKTAGYGVGIGVIHLKVSDFGESPNWITPGQMMPSAALTCNNCGNTVLVNLIVLDMADITGLTVVENVNVDEHERESDPSD